MQAADTQGFIDDGDRSLKRLFFSEWQYTGSKLRCEASNRIVTARRAQVDRNTVVDDGLGVWATPRVSALSTLGLREQIVDLFNELSRIGRQCSRSITQCESGQQRQQCDRDYCNPHSETRPSRAGHARESHERERHDAGGQQRDSGAPERHRDIGCVEPFAN